MSRITESLETAITVPSIPCRPSAALRERLFSFSYCEKSSSNDSSISGVVLDSGLLEFDMRDKSPAQELPATRITSNSAPPLSPLARTECTKSANEVQD